MMSRGIFKIHSGNKKQHSRAKTRSISENIHMTTESNDQRSSVSPRNRVNRSNIKSNTTNLTPLRYYTTLQPGNVKPIK